MDSTPVICKIEDDEAYATFGIPEAYTMMILFTEFHALTEGWSLLPSPCYKRNAQAWVIHETLTNLTENEDFTTDDRILSLQPRIQEGAARGTEINLRADQVRVIDYWAQAGQTEMVVISVTHGSQ
jgi:hypothetical protein